MVHMSLETEGTPPWRWPWPWNSTPRRWPDHSRKESEMLRIKTCSAHSLHKAKKTQTPAPSLQPSMALPVSTSPLEAGMALKMLSGVHTEFIGQLQCFWASVTHFGWLLLFLWRWVFGSSGSEPAQSAAAAPWVEGSLLRCNWWHKASSKSSGSQKHEWLLSQCDQNYQE